MKYSFFLLCSIVILGAISLILFVLSKDFYAIQRFDAIKKELKLAAETMDNLIRLLRNSITNIFDALDVQESIKNYLSRKLSTEGLKKYITIRLADNSLIFNNLIGLVLSYQDRAILEIGETQFLKKRLREVIGIDKVNVDLFKDKNKVFTVFDIPVKVENKQIVITCLFDISSSLNMLSNEVYINSAFDFYNTKPRDSKYGYTQYISSASKYVNFNFNTTFPLKGFLQYFSIFLIILTALTLSIDATAYIFMKKNKELEEKQKHEIQNQMIMRITKLENKLEILKKLISDMSFENIDWNTICEDTTKYLGSVGTFVGLVDNDTFKLLGSYDTRKDSNFKISEIPSRLILSSIKNISNNTTLFAQLKQLPNHDELLKILDLDENSSLYFIPIILEDKIVGIFSVIHSNHKEANEEIKDFIGIIAKFTSEKIKRVLNLEESNRKKDRPAVDQELLRMAMLDQLTRIPNRRYLELKLKSFYKDYRTRGKKFGLIFFDIDNFKKFNDKYGHDCGDMVLKTAGKVLKNVFRSNDTFGRWGGEEFLVIVDDVDAKALYSSAERLRKTIESTPVDCSNQKLRVTVSIGATVVREDDTIDRTVKRADSLMYQAKQRGKNIVVMD